MRVENSVWESDQVWHYFPCELCGSSNFYKLISEDFFSANLTTVVCSECSLFQTNPRGSERNYIAFYENSYRRLYFSSGVRSRQKAPKKKDFAIANFRLELYRNLILDSSTVTEYGAGTGDFAAAILREKKNITLKLSDPDLAVCKQAREWWGVNVEQGIIPEEVDSCEEDSDIVVLLHVLEHVYDLDKTLSTVWSKLKASGVLIIEVPDIEGRWRGKSMFHPAHVRHFSSATLMAALKKNHFEIVQMRRIDNELLESSISIVGRKSHETRDWTMETVSPFEIYLNAKEKLKVDVVTRLRYGLRTILLRLVPFKVIAFYVFLSKGLFEKK